MRTQHYRSDGRAKFGSQTSNDEMTPGLLCSGLLLVCAPCYLRGSPPRLLFMVPYHAATPSCSSASSCRARVCLSSFLSNPAGCMAPEEYSALRWPLPRRCRGERVPRGDPVTKANVARVRLIILTAQHILRFAEDEDVLEAPRRQDAPGGGREVASRPAPPARRLPLPQRRPPRCL